MDILALSNYMDVRSDKDTNALISVALASSMFGLISCYCKRANRPEKLAGLGTS